MQVNGIPAAEYAAVRDKVLPFLEGFAARSFGRSTVASLEGDILAREMQVWAIGDFQAVCLTSVGPDSVNIHFCAGIRRHEWQEDLDNEIQAWARALGKKRVIATVRPGWAKWGKQRGYREAHREMVKEV